MNKKIIYIIGGIILILFIGLLVVRSLSNKDDWICTGAGWIRQGNPILSMPTSGCDEAKKETTSVKIFLGNKNFNPNAEDCAKVYPVERIVEKTPAIARAALIELLTGLTEKEMLEGYYSSVKKDAKIQKLVIEDGVVKVDFSKELEEGIGGSCMTAFIRSQITQTLKQFSTVKEVIISIDGRTEDILQP